MMSDEHRQMAYWSVVKDLEPAADILLASLRDALPEFFRFAGEPNKAGRVLFDCLAGISWDWPAWESFAKKAGHDSLRTISLSISRMRPAEVLKARSLTQLRDLCTERNIKHAPRATKQTLMDAILKGATTDVAAAIVLPYRQALLADAKEKCRAEMARYLAYRILSVAYNRERLDQLKDPELLSIMPFLKFHWCGHTDIDAPKSCRRFDGKRLESQAAITTFPELPCSYLRCVCRLSADTARGLDDDE